MATYDALELEIIGQDRREYIRLRPLEDAEKVLDMFLKSDHRWVRVHSDDGEPKHVLLERVASVTLRRGLDDDYMPVDIS